MMHTGRRALGALRRRPVTKEAGFFKGEWMSSPGTTGVSPTVFLAEQPPHSIVEPHFHRENQFQLFVEGDGNIGPHAIGPYCIHYAGAYTGYGPLNAHAGGLKYFTIRARYDTGLTPIAQARATMPRGPKRHATSGLIDVQDVPGGSDAPDQDIFPPDRGMAAWVSVLPAGSPYKVRDIRGSEGCFVFVLGGSAASGGDMLERWEHIFHAPGEAVDLVAGPGGATVVSLAMPPRDAAYDEAPTADSEIRAGRLVAS